MLVFNSNSDSFNLINSNNKNCNSFFSNSSSYLSIPIQFKFRINSMGLFPTQTPGIILICNCNRHVFSVIVIEELFSKVIIIDPKVIDNSLLLFYYIYCYKLTKYQVCLLFQLLVIVNNVQTMAEPLSKQHEKTSRLIILWFKKYLLNETMQE